ncbi:hypothetical protein DAMA08_012490 [Martiniozyma asiatica (nom. inval.)]|nr:hypothetical protein DAMA08_012490 [Martiniozyma asiatica]
MTLLIRHLLRGNNYNQPCRFFHSTRFSRINPLLPVNPTDLVAEQDTEETLKNRQNKSSAKSTSNDKRENQEDNWDRIKSILSKCIETGLITFSSLIVLVLGGVAYHKMYKAGVLNKIEESFDDSYSLRYLKHVKNNTSPDRWAERHQQGIVDGICNGALKGKYYLIVGEKGTGKTSAVFEGISRVDGTDCAVVECSSDVELMRLRIGHCLHFEFFEDYIGSLFSMKGPRDATPMLDIERAFQKLEEILVARKKKTKKPLVLIFNNSHLIDGALVELLQQKAEEFASSSMLTMVFLSDDYWLFEKMKNVSTRLEVLNFSDVSEPQAIKILKSSREKYLHETLPTDDCKKIYKLIGGRPQHLNHVATAADIYEAAHNLIDSEKIWFLSKCGLLGSDMDDDVMEEGKFSVSAMLLMRELVEMDRKQQRISHSDDVVNASHLPQLPLWRARQVMTRSDYIKQYDRLNIFTIDTDSNVRADSVPMMRAFHEIAKQADFDNLLRESIDRVSEIESINRTREILLKDLVLGGKYKIQRGSNGGNMSVMLEGGTREEEDDSLEEIGKRRPFQMMELHEGERKKWWKKRLEGYEDHSCDDCPEPGTIIEH